MSDETIPPVRYTTEALGILQEISTSVDCECPHHLAGIVLGLQAFERYSRDCESEETEDAQMHRQLYEETAKARARMERVLERLCEYEGIVVEV